MELLYVWIEESSNGFIREQEFNFSREHRFWVEEKDNEYTLKYEKVTSPPPNLYEGTNIQNITAIVGTNGSGKSTVLREILTNKEHLMLFKSNDSFFIEQGSDIKQIEVDGIPISLIKNDNKITFMKYASTLLNESKCVSKNGNISIIDHSNRGIYYNLSNSTFFNAQSQYNRNISYLEDLNIVNIINLFIHNRDFLNKEFKFDFEYITINPNARYSFLKFTDYDNASDSRNKINKFFESKVKNKIEGLLGSMDGIEKQHGYKIHSKDVPYDVIYINIFSIYFYNFLEKLKTEEIEDDSFLDDLDFNIDFNDTTAIKELIRSTFSKFKPNFDITLKEPNFFTTIDSLIDSVQSIKIEQKRGYNAITTNNDFITFLKQLLENDILKAFKFNFISGSGQDIKLSAGENEILTLLSRIECMYRPLVSDTTVSTNDFKFLNSDAIIVLDEPETHLHPEWSRKLIYILTKYLQSETLKNYNFQIILTTNSPFMLSDLQKENIIYLKPKDGKLNIVKRTENTFGANIHTLLKDSFFMDSTIGEFAKQKIQEVNEKLENDKFDYEETSALIDIIGEPIIKNFLKDKLMSKLSNKEKIAKLKAEIEKLENEVGNNDKN